MTRPLIGITTYVIQAQFGAWDVESALVPAEYVQAVERAGGRAVLLPPSEGDGDPALDALDGLILSGGGDLDPELYGQEPHPETGGIVRQRDAAELALLEAALARDLPVLAICRGSQVLNVLRGGDLVQHLPDAGGHDAHEQTPGVFSDHEVRTEGRLAELLGDVAPVKSHHHQGLGRIGTDLEPLAWAEDGTVEAVADPARRFAVGVLWHPEAGEDAALFDALVNEARAYRELRG